MTSSNLPEDFKLSPEESLKLRQSLLELLALFSTSSTPPVSPISPSLSNDNIP